MIFIKLRTNKNQTGKIFLSLNFAKNIALYPIQNSEFQSITL
jgi:hypothetical protein